MTDRSPPLSVTIERPAYGPYGVGHRADGKVVLVRRAIPGDVVLAEAVLEKKAMVEAVALEVLEPSPDRREPRCPAHPECGGCSWMAMNRDAQLRHKRTVLSHTLRKLFNEACPEIPPVRHDEHEFGYRQRARLHIASQGTSPLRIGFFSHGTHRIVPISGCPICLPALDAVIGSLATWSPGTDLSGSVEFLVTDDDQVMAIFYLARPVPNPQVLAERLGKQTLLSGVHVVAPKSGRGEWGQTTSLITVQDEPHCTIPVFPGAFSQANRTMNKALVTHVVERLSTMDGPREILELYSGHGNFTWPLAAAGFSVRAVETGLRLDLLPDHPAVKFTKQDAAAFLRHFARSDRRVDKLLLDPPRWGAKAAIPHIIELSPRKIVYVSCDPNTFARDAFKLTEAGYTMTDVTAFDLMPQTFHTELAVVLER